METQLPFTSHFLYECLYFTSSRFARVMKKMADEAFLKTGLSPNHGFLLLLVYEQPGINQSDLVTKLELQPSTITRFVDKLEAMSLVRRTVEGRERYLFPTDKTAMKTEEIQQAWLELDDRYKDILGSEEVLSLASLLTTSVATMKTGQ